MRLANSLRNIKHFSINCHAWHLQQATRIEEETIVNSPAQERIILIDSLRGYALMGLFLVHMVEYYELFWYSPTDNAINTWVFRIFGGKAYAMFAMLFGVSFYIILKRNADRGTDFRWRFVWRLTLLFMIGYLHSLVYSGDVLQVLAVSGLCLVALSARIQLLDIVYRRCVDAASAKPTCLSSGLVTVTLHTCNRSTWCFNTPYMSITLMAVLPRSLLLMQQEARWVNGATC